MKWSRIAHLQTAKMLQPTQTATKIQMKKGQDQTEVINLVFQELQKVSLMRNLLPPSWKTTTIVGDAATISQP